ncbi:MAG TPA: DMT family transporter [Planctomycetota bacterium]|nr:DMT family transporter [Planctomycetota bacterium]
MVMPGGARSPWSTAGLTSLAMLAFAANSLLCRAALGGARIDAATFTVVRLVSGAVVLSLLVVRRGGPPLRAGNWPSALALLAYAAPFSFAYLRVGTGVGALVLFGAVQATMIGVDLWRGGRPPWTEWAGLALALAGLAWLTVPGATAPDVFGVALMAGAGVAWGVYSLRGRGGDALATTAGNFVRSALLASPLLGAAVWAGDAVHASGLWLAVASGALASGCGYAIWYAALPGLTATRAAVVQLTVPVLAACGGRFWLGEVFTLQLAIATALVLSGVGLAIARRR